MGPPPIGRKKHIVSLDVFNEGGNEEYIRCNALVNSHSLEWIKYENEFFQRSDLLNGQIKVNGRKYYNISIAGFQSRKRRNRVNCSTATWSVVRSVKR
jgi:hypothetical protein